MPCDAPVMTGDFLFGTHDSLRDLCEPAGLPPGRMAPIEIRLVISGLARMPAVRQALFRRANEWRQALRLASAVSRAKSALAGAARQNPRRRALSAPTSGLAATSRCAGSGGGSSLPSRICRLLPGFLGDVIGKQPRDAVAFDRRVDRRTNGVDDQPRRELHDSRNGASLCAGGKLQESSPKWVMAIIWCLARSAGSAMRRVLRQIARARPRRRGELRRRGLPRRSNSARWAMRSATSMPSSIRFTGRSRR